MASTTAVSDRLISSFGRLFPHRVHATVVPLRIFKVLDPPSCTLWLALADFFPPFIFDFLYRPTGTH